MYSYLRVAWQNKEHVVKNFSNFLVHHEYNNQTELSNNNNNNN